MTYGNFHSVGSGDPFLCHNRVLSVAKIKNELNCNVSMACTRIYGAVEVKFHTCCTAAVKDFDQFHNGAALALGNDSPRSPTEMEVLYSAWWW